MDAVFTSQDDLDMVYRIHPGNLSIDIFNEEMKQYIRHTATTIVYMSVCLTCTIWQVLTAVELAYKIRKWLHFAVVFETILSFLTILCSILNPVAAVSCELRFWVSIICVNLGGCCIQTILLYKAYICYDRSKWLLFLGSFINLGYIALTFVYATLGKVPTFKDLLGNCVLHNLEWPALAKLGLDIASNLFLSIAFLMVVYRHYRVFGNSLHKTLLSSGIIFSIGVITSNIITAILISARVMGGLSADLYSFDWVITSYLLIKQFNIKSTNTQHIENEGVEEKEDFERTAATKTMGSTGSSFDISHALSFDEEQLETIVCKVDTATIRNPRASSGNESSYTAVNHTCFDCSGTCLNCLSPPPLPRPFSTDVEKLTNGSGAFSK